MALKRAAATHRRAADLFAAHGKASAADQQRLLAEEAARRADAVRRRGAPAGGPPTGFEVLTAPAHRSSRPTDRVSDARAVLAGMDMLGVRLPDLWLAHVGLGGSLTPEEVGGFLAGRAGLDSGEYDILVLALNELFGDWGVDHPVPYAGEE